MLPASGCVSEIAIPSDTCPIKFKTLYMKLSGNVLQVIGRAHVIFSIEEPVNWVHWRSHVNCIWFEPLSFRRHHDSISLRAAGLPSHPFLGSLQVSRHDDWVALADALKRLSCFVRPKVEDLLD